MLKIMSFLISRNGISLKLIPKLFIKLVGLKMLFILLTKLELLNKYSYIYIYIYIYTYVRVVYIL